MSPSFCFKKGLNLINLISITFHNSDFKTVLKYLRNFLFFPQCFILPAWKLCKKGNGFLLSSINPFKGLGEKPSDVPVLVCSLPYVKAVAVRGKHVCAPGATRLSRALCVRADGILIDSWWWWCYSRCILQLTLFPPPVPGGSSQAVFFHWSNQTRQ